MLQQSGIISHEIIGILQQRGIISHEITFQCYFMYDIKKSILHNQSVFSIKNRPQKLVRVPLN